MSEGRQTENHNHRKLIKLITWTTVLSNSMKLWAMLCRATQDRWVMVESSDKIWYTGEGMANRFSILALRTSWTVWKGKKLGQWKMNFPGRYVPNMLLEISGEITPKWMKRRSQRKKQHSVVDMIGDGSKVWCCKEQYCIGTWNVRSMNLKQIGSGQTGDGKSERRHSKNQRTKMEWNGWI